MPTTFQMGNASDTSDVFASTISKEYDNLMGSLYSAFCEWTQRANLCFIPVGILSLMGNCILLLVAYHKRSTLKPAEFFIINLSISDLGMTLSLFPLAIPWLFGEITCQLYAMCGVLFGLCSLTNLTALSLVCCLKVCFPNHGNKFSSTHARLLVVGVWCYASVFAVGPLAQWGHYSPEPYGTACCIDWHAPNHELSALSYIVCLFVFCYALPCTVIFLSYAFILLTVRGSRQAVQQHVSPQTKTTNAHSLIVKLSVAVCIGFLGAWSPYAVVAMWAAFGDAMEVPPQAFALAAIFAKSSTIYNPMVYLLCKPNFRECLYRDTSMLRQRIYRGSPQSDPKECFGSGSQRNKDMSVSTRFSNGQQEGYGACLHCNENAAPCHAATPQRTACILTGSTYREVTVTRLSAKPQADLL
ncbi:G-protein coupled receptor 136 [Collichthys lucidus]|uniref:G-protein coupled receptor 136 n=1 Tax=Collichthys lucidus TaxID=240159 RepID=A0A4U5UQH8_COLLU|nr:G-protein coupled receptor 136 [Collichthys lucidus]